MTVIKSEWITREQYQETLSNLETPDTTIYHRLQWLDVLVNGFGAEICFICSLGADDVALAVTPFICKRKGPFRLIGSPLRGMHTEFAGPLLRKGLAPEKLASVMTGLHQLLVKKNHYIEWGSKGEESWGHILTFLGYSKSLRSTLLIDLSSGEEVVWASFEGRARNMIRKAEKAGVEVRIIQPDDQWIIGYYEMLVKTFAHQGLVAPHPLAFYRQLIEISTTGLARCMVAEVDGKVIGGSIFLIDDKRMLYLSGVANKLGMTLAASSLLQWHAIKEAIRLGVTQYDMGGMGIPSIDKFKRSFGGHDFSHSRWVYRSSLFKIAEPMGLWAAQKGWIKFGEK